MSKRSEATEQNGMGSIMKQLWLREVSRSKLSALGPGRREWRTMTDKVCGVCDGEGR